MEYIIQKGDTLGGIAQKFTGSAYNYKDLQELNGIKNANLILPGKKIQIPDKFSYPLKKADIPTENLVHIIDNYSPNYNYIIEGEKMYYAKKGRDYWVDISENDRARKNLLQFLSDKYNFRGYEDGERELYDNILNKGWTYATREKFHYPTIPFNPDDILPTNIELTTDAILIGEPRNNSKSELEQIDHANTILLEYSLPNIIEKGINYTKRLKEKLFPSKEDVNLGQVIVEMPDISGYKIKRLGTLQIGKPVYFKSIDQTFIPESLNLSEFTFGARNRGDYRALDATYAPVTSFSPFVPKSRIKKPRNDSASFIGIDANGKFKAGSYDTFGDGDLMARSYSNQLIGFKKENGQFAYTNDAAHGNRRSLVPIALYLTPSGAVKEGTVNLLTWGKGQDAANRITGVSGGKILVQVGNDFRVISGSIALISNEIERLKLEYNVPYLTYYTLDNGSYNRPLRKTKGFSSLVLRSYDNLNHLGGGHFLYIKDTIPTLLQFALDTIYTPNIRTETSESYLKGHPLENELKGVVLHHTGFNTPDASGAIKYLLNPKSEAGAHVVIDYNGQRTIMAPHTAVAFHAGYSRFGERNNVNDFMIGIEFLGNTNTKPLTEELIQSAVEYLTPLIIKYLIPLSNIVTHKNIRDAYNDYAQKEGLKKAPGKSDITMLDYKRVIEALIEKVYYKPQTLLNKFGGKLNYLTLFK